MKHYCGMVCLVLLLTAYTNLRGEEAAAQAGQAGESGITAHARPFGDARLEQGRLDERLRPFYHGVASGDPLSDRVIIWTRITTETDGLVTLRWRMATDPHLREIIKSGHITTGPERDYTAKVDVSGLQPGTTYYYGFSYDGRNSLTGRTKTAPDGGVERLRFAVTSCSNYQQGFFNAYGRMAEHNDIDAVIHLGDYIYEYEEGGYGYNDTAKRGHEPAHEIVSLADYRIRHSFYKLDPDLRRVHQQLPFITVWDDHESTNDSWKDGAENHSDTEGDWHSRKSAAIRAYFEWLPIRESQDRRIYRSIAYGSLAELIMLDTRLEGRSRQILPKGEMGEVDTAEWFNPTRSMLGAAQYEWFIDRTLHSPARWKVIGNQTMMMQVFGFTNYDAWDGYPVERERIFQTLKGGGAKNVVVVTGDIHSSWCGHLASNPLDSGLYNPLTGGGAVGVEFVTPSISSANLNEINKVPPRHFSSLQTEAGLKAFNPQFRLVELDSHGYMILDIDTERIQADWMFVDTILAPSNMEYFYQGWIVRNGSTMLEAAAAPSPDIPNAPEPAPLDPPQGTTNVDEKPVVYSDLFIIGHYPNPADAETTIHYVVSKPQRIGVALYDINGNLIKRIQERYQSPGSYSASFNTASLAPGTYLYAIQSPGREVRRAFSVAR